MHQEQEEQQNLASPHVQGTCVAPVAVPRRGQGPVQGHLMSSSHLFLFHFLLLFICLSWTGPFHLQSGLRPYSTLASQLGRSDSSWTPQCPYLCFGLHENYFSSTMLSFLSPFKHTASSWQRLSLVI